MILDQAASRGEGLRAGCEADGWSPEVSSQRQEQRRWVHSTCSLSAKGTPNRSSNGEEQAGSTEIQGEAK